MSLAPLLDAQPVRRAPTNVRPAPSALAPVPVAGTDGTGASNPATSNPATRTGGSASVEQVLSTTDLLDRVDEMMGQLEERILEELERRGGRFTGYF